MADAGTSLDSFPGGLVLLVGDEEFLVNRAIEQVTAERRRHDPEADVVDRFGAELVAAELYEMLSPSLFGGGRTIVVRNCQDVLSAMTGPLTSFFADPGQDMTLVIHHAGGGKGRAILEAARRVAGTVIPCARITRAAEREQFVRAEVKGHKATIRADAVAALIDAVGTDLRELSAVCAQLSSDSGGKIDVDIVTDFHRGRANTSGFTVADSAMAGRTGEALENLRWALSLGVHPVLIADALADGVRSVARVASARRASPAALAGELGMAPWKIERAQKVARGWTAPRLEAAIAAVAKLNADVKGAAADPDFALEQVIRQLTAAGSTPG